MMNGRNNGKKLMAVRIVAHSFEIVRSVFPVFIVDPLFLFDIVLTHVGYSRSIS